MNKEKELSLAYSNVIKKFCEIEYGEDAILTSSGIMAIFTTITGLLSAGDNIIIPKSLTAETLLFFKHILPKFGITHTIVDLGNEKSLKENITPVTKMVFLETPANPLLDIYDLKKLAKICSKNNLYLVIDNTNATPCLQNPLKYGADLVIHFADKFIDSVNGDSCGIVIGNERYIKNIKEVVKILNPAISELSAYYLLKSIETLQMRIEKICKNAFTIAGFLEDNKKIEWIRYPFLASHPDYELAKSQMKGGGGVITFKIKGTKKSIEKFLKSLKVLKINDNNKNTNYTKLIYLFNSRYSELDSSTQKANMIEHGLISIVVGIDDVEEIIKDLREAFSNI